MKKIDKHFISEIDRELAKFDATHPKSASQEAEIKKYKRIISLRDEALPATPPVDDLWEDF